jgi:hypothetical protein
MDIQAHVPHPGAPLITMGVNVESSISQSIELATELQACGTKFI